MGGMSGAGGGLAKGLAVTLKTMTNRADTRQYPDVAPDLPPRSRGVIALFEENCTVCMLCARECPDWCIYIDSHKEEVVVPGAARPRQRNVLDRFAIDFALCMYCGICIEACPFDALYWSPEFEYAEYDIRDLLHEKDRLRDWMWTVPPPPAHDLDRPRWPGLLVGGGAGVGLAALLGSAYRWSRVTPPPSGSAARIGAEVFRSWVLPFEVLSVLLLAALVGAIVVSRTDVGERS